MKASLREDCSDWEPVHDSRHCYEEVVVSLKNRHIDSAMGGWQSENEAVREIELILKMNKWWVPKPNL
jgi:hypothetical protein